MSVDFDDLKQKAVQYRKDILFATNSAGSGHPGGSLSAVEVLIGVYDYKMNHRPQDPKWDGRDRLVVSKGHITPGVYTALANQGYFDKSELKNFRQFGSLLQGHVHQKVPGVEFNTGSLGQGLSVANGIALAARLQNKDYKAYCLMGDGEIQEGSVWEAAMTAPHYKIDNVCAIVDYNKVQENGPTNEIKNLEPLVDKWKSFGWEVANIDGHSIEEVCSALDAFEANIGSGKPFCILANTVKGKGISFMENNKGWHFKAPNDEQYNEALAELN